MSYSYCSGLTRQQLINVLNDEYQRMRRFHKGTDAWVAAQQLYQECREEMLRQGMEPDEYLTKSDN